MFLFLLPSKKLVDLVSIDVDRCCPLGYRSLSIPRASMVVIVVLVPLDMAEMTINNRNLSGIRKEIRHECRVLGEMDSLLYLPKWRWCSLYRRSHSPGTRNRCSLFLTLLGLLPEWTPSHPFEYWLCLVDPWWLGKLYVYTWDSTNISKNVSMLQE